MASMDDLLATFNHDLRAGPQGNDLRDLHAKLAQTLNNPIPYQHHRPIPPPAPSTSSTGTGAGPLPPPAPASSWNTPPPNTSFLFSSSPQPKSFTKGFPPSSSSSNPNVKRESGFFPTTIPERDETSHQSQQANENVNEERPYHASVLPVKADPKETNGFTEDAFRPIWDGKSQDQWSGFKQKGT
ncbi:hypothetical protein V865_002974 [Kwoniella europaea PYCC6329]|uniref:Uncharacterized protein n=1 Tax=Kwoniella europaea PYCC6329 TaxID=1423913 RepID=A0AAX4KFV9_9TREE